MSLEAAVGELLAELKSPPQAPATCAYALGCICCQLLERPRTTEEIHAIAWQEWPNISLNLSAVCFSLYAGTQSELFAVRPSGTNYWYSIANEGKAQEILEAWREYCRVLAK